MKIERGFRYLKSFVEIRPVYHRREERIKAHVMICILAYLLSNTVEQLVRKKERI
jgi:transposase